MHTPFIFNTLKIFREKAIGLTDGLSHEQLLFIPDGHNNNLLWNLGHIVTSQQGLCYRLSGQPLLTPEHWPKIFGKGSKPRDWDMSVIPSIEEIVKYMHSTMDVFEEHYRSGKLSNYTEYPTSSGAVLKSIEDALLYNYGHEQMHLGVMMAQRKHV